MIIPAKNASDSLPGAIASIQAQTYPNIVEVIVAAADDETAAAASPATVVENPTGSTPAGLNRALQASSGEVIVRCDTHATFASDYVATAVDTLIRTGAVNVGGLQDPVGMTVWERSIGAAMKSRLGAGDARYRIGGPEGPVETVYLGVYRRSTLDELGGFDENFVRTQDYELNHRIISSGGQVWFDPNLTVAYRPRANVRGLAEQFFQYGRAKRQFSKKHPGALKPRQLAPPVFAVGIASTVVASLFWPWLAIGPVAYATLLIFEASRTATPSTLRTAAALATMHFSWGSGFLTG